MSVNPSISAVISQFNMQVRLYNNVLEGIKSTDSSKQVSDNLNHISWLAGHLAHSRFSVGTFLGLKDKSPYDEFYKDFKPIDPKLKYPSLEESKAVFTEITGKIMPAFDAVTEEHLSSPIPFEIPIGDSTVRGFLAFLSHHEAYHIGQLASLRRSLGYGPMKY